MKLSRVSTALGQYRLKPQNARQSIALVVAIAAVIGVGLSAVAIYKHVRWKRFAVVAEDKVYRSGYLRIDQLDQAIDKLELKTVICLNPKVKDQEQVLCRQKGIRFVAYDMPSSGLGKPEDFVEVVNILTDPRQQPVLVHCRAGVARTGAAVALYRMSHDGWTQERALAEQRSFERKGRCEPSLRDHIVNIYEKYFDPSSDSHVSRAEN